MRFTFTSMAPASTALGLFLAASVPSLAGTVQVLDDDRSITLSVLDDRASGGVGTLESRPADGALLFDDTALLEGFVPFSPAGTDDDFQIRNEASATHLSVIEQSDNQTRVAGAFGTASRSDFSSSSGPVGADATSQWTFAFRVDAPTDYALQYSLLASGDEAFGGFIELQGPSNAFENRVAGFGNMPTLQDESFTEDPLAFDIVTDFEVAGLAPSLTRYESKVGANNFVQSGTLSAGDYVLTVGSSTSNDADDAGAVAEAAFEFMLTADAQAPDPIPTPTAALGGLSLMIGLVLRRRSA
jgi:hypothetical protein